MPLRVENHRGLSLLFQGAAAAHPDDRHPANHDNRLYLCLQGAGATYPDDQHPANDQHEASAEWTVEDHDNHNLEADAGLDGAAGRGRR